MSSVRGRKRPLKYTRVGSSSITLRTAAHALGCSLQAAWSMAVETMQQKKSEKKRVGGCARNVPVH